MLHYFPHFYADELLYSVIARYHRHVGNVGYKTTLLDLFGARTVCAAVDFPSHIQCLVDRFPPHYGLNANDVLYKHTLFPYYTRYLNKNAREKIRDAMFGNDGGGIQALAGLVAFKIRPPSRLRVCPQCAKSDATHCGEIYWHRVHQLPGVFICPIHGCWLMTTDVSYHPIGKHEFVDAADAQNACVNVPSINVRLELVEIAQRSQGILCGKKTESATINYGSHYRTALLTRGFARGQFINQVLLEEEFLDRFSSLLPLLNCDLTLENESNWLRSIPRKHRKAMHPLHHILIQMFLDHKEEVPIPVKAVHSAKRYSVDPSERSKKRDQWSTARIAFPDHGVKELRKHFTALYTWLYRHDYQWLFMNRPSVHRAKCGPRIDWAIRDQKYCERLKAILLKYDKTIKPVWRTKSKFLLLLDSASTVRKNKRKLPCTWELLERIAESRVEFQKRRIEWAASRIVASGDVLQEWRLIRLASLRQPLHLDVARKIMELIGVR